LAKAVLSLKTIAFVLAASSGLSVLLSYLLLEYFHVSLLVKVSVSIIILAIVLGISGLYIKREENVRKEILKALQKLGSGDFTSLDLLRELSKKTTIKEFQNFAESILVLQENARDIIESTMRLFNEVKSKNQELSNRIKAISNNATNIAQSVEKFAYTTQNAADRAIKVSESTENAISTLTEQIERLTEFSQQMRKSSDNLKEALSNIRMLLGNIKKTKENLDEILDRVKKFEEYIRKISSTTLTIKDIADQTNIIAINAAIEAAREESSGTGGSVFTIVAEEVRKLAETSKEMASEIESAVRDITEISKSNVKFIEESLSQIGEMISQVEQRFQETSNIGSHIIELAGTTEKIADELSTQGLNTMKFIRDNISELTSMFEELTSTVQEINSIMQELTANLKEMSEASDTLDISVLDLKTSLERFKA